MVVGRTSALLLALLAAGLACPAAARDACGFTQRQPRFFQGATTITALNVEPSGSLFLNDDLLRTLTRQLGLEECQVQLTQGLACDAALATAPCPDPSWLCGGDVVLANSVYRAAKSGLCTEGSTQEICSTLRATPGIAAAVAAGDCTPRCFAWLGEDDAAPAPGPAQAPAPAPASKSPVACFAFTLQVDSASDAEARKVAVNLHNASTAGVLLDTLAGFSAPSRRIAFLLGDTGALRCPMQVMPLFGRVLSARPLLHLSVTHCACPPPQASALWWALATFLRPPLRPPLPHPHRPRHPPHRRP